ncbi:MAG: hypothetical protein H6617_06055 [Bdellovibrionaceae bacterium]|nr:hypothetical protein [Bdellovibrionales bacterium]MCB9254227.1 hypothetical protein [Pseudobdellovibrionaceae bacterium]
MRTARILFLVFLVFMVGVPVWWYTEAGFDPGTLLVQGGMVLENGKAVPMDLRLKGQRILEMGQLSPIRGEKIVSVSGQLVLPGFVESGHDPKFDSKLAVQSGVTSVVLPDRRAFTEAAEQKSATNVGWVADYFEIENEVLKQSPQAPLTAVALNQGLARQMQLGAIGVYFDLRQGLNPQTEQALNWLAPELKQRNGLLLVRLQGADKSLWDELETVLQIAEKAQVPLHLADLQLSSEKVWNRANHLVARLEKARAAGLNVTFDFNPLLPLQPSDLQTFLEDPRGFISTNWAMAEETLQQTPETVSPPVLGLSQLIVKRSSLAANAFGLKDRGKLEAGAFADLVLLKAGESFDALQSLDKFQQSISQVWVNGELVFKEKVLAPAGKPLYGSPPAHLSE